MSRRRAWALGIAGAVVIAAVVVAIVWLARPAVSPSSPPGESRPAPSASPTATVLEQTQTLLDAHLRECAESIESTPPGKCGIRIPWGGEFSRVSEIRYRIEKLPTVELTDEGFVAGGGVLVATVTGTGQDGSARVETYRTEDWTVRGDTVITGSGVAEISPW